MKADNYVKTILTIITALLFVLVLQRMPFFNDARAFPNSDNDCGGIFDPCYVIVK